MIENTAIALLRLLSWLPLPWLHAAAVPLGWLARFMPWTGHDVIRTNLAICFPEKTEAQRERLYRQNLIEMLRLIFESGAVWHWPASRLEAHVPFVDGWQHVEKARSEGRGVLLVGSHFGNWEILLLWMSLQGPFTALYKAPRKASVDQRITRSRTRFGARMVSSGSPAMRHLLAGLRRGEAVGVLADQKPKQGEGLFADFFGRPALSMTLVNRLARRTECAVFLFSAERLPRGRGWRLHFDPADEAIASADPATGIQVMHHMLERTIRRDPAQYLWSYKRFSLQPGGRPSPYPKSRKRRKQES